MGVDAREFPGELLRLDPAFCVCRASFLMTFARGGAPAQGNWLFRKSLGNVCIHMYVCMYLFCVYVCNTHVCVHMCIHANMHECVCMCMYMGMCVCLRVCVCVCILCACTCVLAVPVYLHVYAPLQIFILDALFPLSSVGSLGFPESRHFVFSLISVISSYCLTASFRTIMNSEDRGSLT